MPLVSVIIPTYNRAGVTTRAIESVINQSFKDFELIIVDDGSTEEYDYTHLEESNIIHKIIRLEANRGVSFARNRGIDTSKGEFLSFLDSDDTWFKHKLKRQIEWFQQNKKLSICQTDEIWIRAGKRVNKPKHFAKIEGYIFKESLENCTITPSSVMIKREVINRVGMFNEKFKACEDYDLWLRITKEYEIGLINEHLITRYGGEPDQLSLTIPLQDRFRVDAIIDILESSTLTDIQRGLSINTLIRKATILYKGALKRNKTDRAQKYLDIIKKWS